MFGPSKKYPYINIIKFIELLGLGKSETQTLGSRVTKWKMKDIIYFFKKELLIALKKLFGAKKRHLQFWFWHFPQNGLFQSCDILSGLHVTVWSYILKTWAREGHAIKPATPEHGTTEHGTPAEQRNTTEQWWNNSRIRNAHGAPT